MSLQNSLKLRRATIDDLYDLIEFAKPFFYESYWGKMEFSEKRTRERFTYYISDLHTLIIKDTEILGMATLAFDHYYAEDLICDIELFYVAPKARKTGISRVLRDACENFAKQMGARIICATSSSGAEDDRFWVNLFKKIGFLRLGTVMVKEL